MRLWSFDHEPSIVYQTFDHSIYYSNKKDENIVLRASSMETIYSAVKAGFGIGLLPHVYKKMDNSLVELSEPDPKFGSTIWLITQKELINNEKIKICLSFFYKELRKVFHY